MNPTGQTIRSLIDYHADKSPDQTFVSYPETGISHTWSEFQVRVQAIAGHLTGLKLPSGVPVTGLLGNGQAALEFFFGWNVRWFTSFVGKSFGWAGHFSLCAGSF